MYWKHNFSFPILLVTFLSWENYLVKKTLIMSSDLSTILPTYVKTFNLPWISLTSCSFFIRSFVKLSVILIYLLFSCFLLLNTIDFASYLANVTVIGLVLPFEFLKLPTLRVLSKSSMLTSTLSSSQIIWMARLLVSSYTFSFTFHVLLEKIIFTCCARKCLHTNIVKPVIKVKMILVIGLFLFIEKLLNRQIMRWYPVESPIYKIVL